MPWGMENPEHPQWKKFNVYQFCADYVKAQKNGKKTISEIVNFVYDKWYDDAPLSYVRDKKIITKEELKLIMEWVRQELSNYGFPNEYGLGIECASVRFWGDRTDLWKKHRDFFQRTFEGRAMIAL